MEAIRWGIVGSGWIARKLAEALAVLPDAKLMGIGSRKQETADAFGEEFDIPLRFGSYEALVQCPDIDVVYIATPHTSHLVDASLALRAGKAVLCEKPLTVNARETQALISLARAQGLFFMEAMWTRFIPAVVKLREWMAAGVIGEPRFLSANIGWNHPYDEQSRLFSPALAGGALLDIGIYPVSLASMLLGTPSVVSGVMHPTTTGVDMQCSVSLLHPSGALANFVASLRADPPRDAVIVGSEGWIRIHPPLNEPETLSRGTGGTIEETMHLPRLGNGYPHEAIEVMDCLRQGKLESDSMPLNESLTIMQTLDSIRAQWGLRYAADDE